MRAARSHRLARLLAVPAAACLLTLLPALPAAALPPARVVVEGVAPAGEHAVAGVPVRSAALRAGLRAAIAQTALDLIAAEGGQPGDLDVLALLGGKATDYTQRYRVLADLGERLAPAPAPEGAFEYALQVEVHVDVDRIAAGLQSAGWLQSLPGELPTQGHRILVETRDWGAYEAFLALLRDGAGARSALPESFESGRVALRVEAPGRSAELLDRLLAVRQETLRLIPLPSEGDVLRIQVARTGGEEPASPEGAQATGD
ncbi:MAG: hypothetical protein CL910_16365 [Deltaproteobacteria bacterium]|jgi:hypothetical protein|nr:hypothetical protein [Deltaproteobacteria bacterium]